MRRFVLIPGAGGIAWYWHRVVRMLGERGHEAIAVDLPADDPAAGLELYAERVVAAIAGREHTLVAQSMGGFTAAMVCGRVAVQRLVFVNAMIPAPGETPGEWGEHVGSRAVREAAARRGGYSPEFDEAVYFFHDVSREDIEEGAKHERPEADRIFGQVCAFEGWPAIPMHVIAGRDDRMFPIELQRRVARERLGVEVDELRGGHLIALSNAGGVVDQLLSYG